MTVKAADIAAFDRWVDGLAREHRIMGPCARDNRFLFGPVAKASELRLDCDVTILPPKVILQPPSETLLRFDATSGYESVIDSEPLVLFGVHPYDMVAILQMDEIFSQGNPDIHYLSRRANATMVVVDVQNVGPGAFAGYMGTSHVESGYDVLLTRIGDEYLVDAATTKGEALVAGLTSASDATKSQLQLRRDVWDSNRLRLRKHDLKAAPAEWPNLLEDAYEDPMWQERAELCFSCGSCNLVCPTCYCFDVSDDVNWDLTTGQRNRFWDGCMLADFAMTAGHLNFRNEPAARYRHRYYRKGKYVPARIGGQIACVGCGRCITACVANIANPVEVFNRLSEARR